MATILKFRPFRLTNIVESQFLTSDSKANKEFAIADLARSGLTMEDVAAEAPSMMKLKDGALAGYTIPYFGLDGEALTDGKGNLVMYRERFKYPEFSREQRYRQPHGDVLAKHNLPPSVPYFHPLSFSNPGDEAIVCEGEKKTAAVLRSLGVPALGIGGCQSWRNPDKSGTVHPWILSYLRQRNILAVRIVPDGDIFRYDICNAYGTFARALEAEGIKVRIVNPRDKIDDLIVGWHDTAKECFGKLEEIPINDLVQSPASLIAQFGLAFKSDAKDRPIVYQHSSNITKILEGHRAAFPEIWLNTDTNTLMFGEEKYKAAATEMDITNYFQHNLGFHNVKTHHILECIVAQGKRNARSPFLDYVRAQQWDGVKRLETWLQDYWGVGDSPYIREVGTKWLVSACARLAKPGVKIDWMLITTGAQGVGKTSMPKIFFGEHSQIIFGDHSDKDFLMKLNSALCNVIDEMDSWTKKDGNFYKALVSAEVDSFRPPYGRTQETYERRFILYGCGNRREILPKDHSGQRRYSVVDVGRQMLYFKGLAEVKDQLWAEAWAVYNSGGADYWEVKGNTEHAKEYEQQSPFMEGVESFLAKLEVMEEKHKTEPPGQIYFTISDLKEHLEIKDASPNSSINRELGEILESVGVERPGRDSTRHPIQTNRKAKWWVYRYEKG